LSGLGERSHVALLEFLLILSNSKFNLSVLSGVGDPCCVHEFDFFKVSFVLRDVVAFHVVYKIDILVAIVEGCSVFHQFCHSLRVLIGRGAHVNVFGPRVAFAW